MLQIKSLFIQTHQKRSRSSSNSSRTNESLKLKQAEAKAAAAEKQAQLEAELETQQLEDESFQLQSQVQQNKRRIIQAKLRAELRAEKAKEQIFSQAIAEEDDSRSLLRLPSAANIPASNVQQNQKSVSVAPDSYTPRNGGKARARSLPPLPSAPNVPRNQKGVVVPPESSAPHNHVPRTPLDQMRNAHASKMIQQSPVTIASTVFPDHFAEDIAEAINTVRQRPDEPPVFYGDPIKYSNWKATFEEAFELKQSSPAKKWLKLQQYVGGRALAAIESLSRRKTEEAWELAWRKLDKRFGRPEIVADAIEEQLANWPKIRANDGEQLENFLDFLESCAESEVDLNLDTKSTNKKLILKLPQHVAQKWTAKATKLEHRYNKFPPLSDFIAFLSAEADTANNTLTKTLLKTGKVEKTSATK